MNKHEVLEKMKNVVESCMGEEKAGCVATCPMHTDVKSYVRLIKEGNGEEAIKVIREKLFIPGTLGRICPHGCENNCKWNEVKNPIAIASLKRFAADNFDDENKWDINVKASNSKKVAVIGAGPSGLQSAIDMRKEGFDVTVFEKLPVRGGMMRVGIPCYRLPKHVLEKEISYLDKLNVKFEMNFEVSKDNFDKIINDFDAVVIAVGKSEGRVDKSLKNVEAKGVFTSPEVLKEVALTGKFDKIGERVLVVGGGDVAMDCARSARRLNGVKSVHAVCLENSFDSMASFNHEIEAARAEGVSFDLARAIKSINVSNGKVDGVVLKKCTSMFDAQGNFAPKFDENDVKNLDVDTIIFAIGHGVDGKFTNGMLEQRGNSTFECNKETLQSSKNEKVFIAGDASGESFVVVQAMATGARAAESVRRYLAGESLTAERSLADTWTYKSKLSKVVDWSKSPQIREDMQELSIEERLKSFDEVAKGYTVDEATREADRCKQCQCNSCVNECEVLRVNKKVPKTIFSEYLEKGLDNIDGLTDYSLEECKKCTSVCPKELDIHSGFELIKEEMK